MEIITDKNKIYEIARNDPVVHTLMTMVELGQITFEQAMMSGVSILSEQCAEMQKVAVDALSNSIQPHAFQQMRALDSAYAVCPHRARVNYPSLGEVVECEYPPSQ